MCRLAPGPLSHLFYLSRTNPDDNRSSPPSTPTSKSAASPQSTILSDEWPQDQNSTLTTSWNVY